MDHLPMIIIVSWYIRASYRSLENTDRRNWVSTSLCEKAKRSFPKDIVFDHIYLTVI